VLFESLNVSIHINGHSLLQSKFSCEFNWETECIVKSESYSAGNNFSGIPFKIRQELLELAKAGLKGLFKSCFLLSKLRENELPVPGKLLMIRGFCVDDDLAEFASEWVIYPQFPAMPNGQSYQPSKNVSPIEIRRWNSLIVTENMCCSSNVVGYYP